MTSIKRLFITAALVLGSAVAISPVNNAGAASGINLWETSGSQAVGVPSLTAGTDMTEVNHPGRTLFWDANTRHLTTTNGLFVASDWPGCNFVLLKSSSSANGTLWHFVVSGDGFLLINNRCDADFGSPNTQGLAGFNQNGRRLGICGLPSDCTGLFRRWSIITA